MDSSNSRWEKSLKIAVQDFHNINKKIRNTKRTGRIAFRRVYLSISYLAPITKGLKVNNFVTCMFDSV